MCGRFNVIDNPELQQLLRDLGIEMALPPAINIAPTETIAVVTADDTGRQLQAMRWWLTPSWAPEVSTRYSMFNAKSETLATSRAFKQPFQRRRGIVPVSSFIEWKREGEIKQPYLIEGSNRALSLAAIWDTWERGDKPLVSCALLTTAASSEFSTIHHRMPVMLNHEENNLWLEPGTDLHDLQPLFESTLKQDLNITPINSGINNSRNKDPELLNAVAEGVRMQCSVKD